MLLPFDNLYHDHGQNKEINFIITVVIVIKLIVITTTTVLSQYRTYLPR